MENNEITLDKIELVKDRTGVSYREAKEALEKNDGNVVDAIVSIEDTINISVKKDSKVNELVAKVKEIVKKGNVAKVVISKNEQTVLNLPVNAGIVGTVLFPWAMLAAVIAAFGTKCVIELYKDNGEVVNLSEKAGSAVETVVSKGGVVFDEVKDKSSDLFDAAKEKGTQVFDAAKEKGTQVFDAAKEKGTQVFNTVKDKGSDFVEAAVDKGENFVEMAKNKASELKTKAPEQEGMQSDDFDLSDLELDEMQPAEEDIADVAVEPEYHPLKDSIESVKENIGNVIEQVKDTAREKFGQAKAEEDAPLSDIGPADEVVAQAELKYAEAAEEVAPVYDAAECEDHTEEPVEAENTEE